MASTSRPKMICPACATRLSTIEAYVEALEAAVEHLQESAGTAQRASSMLFVASEQRTTFHRPNCPWATEIRDHNLIEFSDHEEAVEAGYKPCKTCRS